MLGEHHYDDKETLSASLLGINRPPPSINPVTGQGVEVAMASRRGTAPRSERWHSQRGDGDGDGACVALMNHRAEH